MGQYFIVVNLDKKEYLKPHDFPMCGAKLGEFSSDYDFCLALNSLLAQGFGPDGWERKGETLGRWAGDRIVVVGDYDESSLYQEAQNSTEFQNISHLVQSKFTETPKDPPTLQRLPPHNLSELTTAKMTFGIIGQCPPIPLIQGWKQYGTQIEFAEWWSQHQALAQLGWRDGRVWVLGTLTDADVFNEATADNQNTWEMGDVFEVFVRRSDSDAYTEAHVTPNGIRLHLKFPDRTTIALARSGQLDGDTLKCDPTEIIAHAWHTEEGWVGLLGVPVEAAPGEKIRVSVCRYDAHRDAEPDVASTSNHAVCDFHRPDDWPEYTVP